MRRITIIGACVAGAALAASALAASSALAAKDPYSLKTWGQFKYCPWQNTELTDCIYGRTNGGSEGGEFQYGHVRVKLSKPVVIQGGANGYGDETNFFPAANGGTTIESPPLKVSKGINIITPQIQQEAGWPEALKEAFLAAKKAKETKMFVQIEIAGNECYEAEGCVDTENLLGQEGTTFRLPLKVKVTGPLLEKLGGGPCEVGNDEHPIHVNLTTGNFGLVGEIAFNEEFTMIEIKENQLVDVNWHISKESGATGCGGEYESYVDKAMNLALEIESNGGNEFASKTGMVWLRGDLFDASVEAVRERGEKGEL
jgi:hypothetical protein